MLRHDVAWPIIGIARTVAVAALLVGVVWLVALWAAGGATPTATADMPVLGPMPTPAVLILVGLIGWFLLGRVLHWHASRLGRAWADRWTSLLHEHVSAVVAAEVDQLLGRLEAARGALWSAADSLRSEVGREELPS